MLYWDLLFMIAYAAFYYKLGVIEFSSGLIPAALSLLLYVISSFVLHWGFLGCLLLQAVLFAALILYNIIRNKPA